MGGGTKGWGAGGGGVGEEARRVLGVTGGAVVLTYTEPSFILSTSFRAGGRTRSTTSADSAELLSTTVAPAAM